jgi:uncharacterized ferritin-like protein (DUF455 family)
VTEPASLTAGALAVLGTADVAAKIGIGRMLAARWRQGILPAGDPQTPPPHPARPLRPELRPPREMRRRRVTSGVTGRVALLHAVAHIELNAVDLAWDLVARFASPGEGFHDDWVRVADEEAQHFSLIRARLQSLGADYGDLPAHDGMWDSALATNHDLLARLAVVPMVLEARGLDVTPPMMERLARVGDHESAALLKRILDDEIGHVEIGRKWFVHLCEMRDLEPLISWQSLVRRYYRGALKSPFNSSARSAAGLFPAFYEPLAETAAEAVARSREMHQPIAREDRSP